MSVNSAPNWNSMPMLAAQREQRRRGRGRGTDWPATSTRARLRAQLAADQAQDRRLAAAGAAHDRDDLAARDRHVDARQDRPAAVVAERHVGELDGDFGRTAAADERRPRRRAWTSGGAEAEERIVAVCSQPPQ